MTKVVRTRDSKPIDCDGNQKDIHPLELSSDSLDSQAPLQQLQLSDGNNVAKAPVTLTDACAPISLSELSDLESDSIDALDLVSNQTRFQLHEKDKLEASIDFVSLELLAMQSPHGGNQQWTNKEENKNASVALARLETSPRQKMDRLSTGLRPLSLNIASPMALEPSCTSSSTQSSTNDDYGLASPMSLPNTPSQSGSAIVFSSDLELPGPPAEAEATRARKSCKLGQCKSVQKLDCRASIDMLKTGAVTPNPRNEGFRKSRANVRLTRSSLPALPEFRGKTRHGGIYSLLLKNKFSTQKPVLIKEAHSPEELSAIPSVSKVRT